MRKSASGLRERLALARWRLPYPGKADIAQVRKKAVNEVKDEIGGIAMEIASKVVEREICEEDHRDLIDEFIKNVGEAS